MLNTLKKFENVVVYVLAALMAVTILFSTVELAITLAKDLLTPPFLMLEINELLEVFGLFLMVLLGLELLETIKAYMREDVVHVEVVLLVAIIAISRKVVILDLKELDGPTLAGLAALMAALVAGYVYIKRVHSCPPDGDRKKPHLP